MKSKRKGKKNVETKELKWKKKKLWICKCKRNLISISYSIARIINFTSYANAIVRQVKDSLSITPAVVSYIYQAYVYI